MADGRMYVNKPDEFVYEWWGLETADKPTSVAVAISRINSGTREYLQGDDTWSVTVATRAATNTASSGKRSEWTLAFTPIASAEGYALRAEATPTSAIDLEPQTLDVYITTADEDTLQAEHDVTQSQLASIASGESSLLVVPQVLTIPFSGTNAFRIELVVIDDDTGALVNADATPTLVARDEAGSTPTGLTISAATNSATGRYRWDVTVATTATAGQQVFWEAAYTEGGESRVRLRASRFEDEAVVAGGGGSGLVIVGD